MGVERRSHCWTVKDKPGDGRGLGDNAFRWIGWIRPSNQPVGAMLSCRGLARHPQDARPPFLPPIEAEDTETVVIEIEVMEATKVNVKGLD